MMPPMRTLLVIGSLLALASCGAASETSPEPRPEASSGGGDEVSQPGEPLAELPFAAQAIRDATPAGRTYVFRFEEDGAQRFERWVFERVDERGFTSTSTPVDEDGQPTGPVERAEGTWDELESHAHFPAARTTITNAQLTIPLGAFRCRLYTVTSEDEQGREVVSRYWFAVDLPGAPVRMVREVDGEPVLTMMIVAHEPPLGGR